MINKTKSETKVIVHNPRLTGGFDPMFEIENHSFTAKRSENLKIYSLQLSLYMMDNRNKQVFVYLAVRNSAEYTIDKNIDAITEGDLFQCIIASTHEINKVIAEKNLLHGDSVVPPPRQAVVENLQTLLNKRHPS